MKISMRVVPLALVGLFVSMAHATEVSYSFTGVVTAAVGAWATYNGQSVIGDTVTGTYTFDYAAAIPSQSSGTPGVSAWSSYSNYAGTLPVGASLVNSLVFTSTAQVVGTNIAYATTAPSPGYNIGAYAVGYNNGGSEFQASEQANQASGGDTQSSFGIGGVTPGQVFDAYGGPVYPSSLPSGSGSGEFAVTTGSVNANSIGYIITSIGPAMLPTVPEPSTWALLVAGFGLLGAVSRRHTPGDAG